MKTYFGAFFLADRQVKHSVSIPGNFGRFVRQVRIRNGTTHEKYASEPSFERIGKWSILFVCLALSVDS